MLRQVVIFMLFITLSLSHHAVAEQSKPVIKDILKSRSLEISAQTRESIDAKMQSCESDEVGAVTIYSTTGRAQAGIDVSIDGNTVGSLTTYYGDIGPECQTPGSEGVITIVLPAGKHTMDAESFNFVWPNYSFVLDKCECLLIPLSKN